MQTLNKQQQIFQQVKEARLQQLINGGLLKRHNARSILSEFTDTVRRTMQVLSESIEKEIMILAVFAYLTLL